MNQTHAEKPHISIVISVLNAVATIEQCLSSIQAQSFKAFEVIVIDGASSDGTLEILQRWSDRITYWDSQADSGVYQAWNRALPHCRGDYICFIGADDWFEDNNCLLDLAESTQTEPDLVLSQNRVVYEANGRDLIIGRPWSWEDMCRQMWVCHRGALHHRRLFRQYGNFNESFRIAGDYDFLLRCGPDTRSVFLDRVTVSAGADGLSMKQTGRSLREQLRVQWRSPYATRIGAVSTLVRSQWLRALQSLKNLIHRFLRR
jgi:glycosyltransferase involved in cell wall biosynthesis